MDQANSCWKLCVFHGIENCSSCIRQYCQISQWSKYYFPVVEITFLRKMKMNENEKILVKRKSHCEIKISPRIMKALLVNGSHEQKIFVSTPRTMFRRDIAWARDLSSF